MGSWEWRKPTVRDEELKREQMTLTFSKHISLSPGKRAL